MSIHDADRFIADPEFLARGQELDADAAAFQGFLQRYLAIMDWLCANEKSQALDKAKQTIDVLKSYKTDFAGDGHYASDCQNFINDIDNDDTWLYSQGSSIYRDFTEPTKETLLNLANALQQSWSSLSMSIESIVDKIMWSFGWRPSDVDTYDATVTTMNDATPDQINQIWSSVSTTDGTYATGFGNLLTTLNSQISAFEKITTLLSHSSYEASTYGYTDAETIYNTVAFDQYGGDQGFEVYPGAPYDFSALAAIVRSYPAYKDMTDAQIMVFLQGFNPNGCPYIALTNSLLQHYAHDPAAFEKRFNIPLMADGHYNYAGIATDFYCWVLTTHPDIANQSGLNIPQTEDFWPAFCQAHGVSSKVTQIDVTPSDYKEKAENGTITIAIHPVDGLYNLDGTPYTGNSTNVNDGHEMVVTGVTEDGRYIVSSWGREYYFDPSNPAFNEWGASIVFTQVTYD